jgi:hypothetical protein
LVHDASYHCVFEIKGVPSLVSKQLLSCVFPPLDIAQDEYVYSRRRGQVLVYQPDLFPRGLIGEVEFLWVETTSLVVFCHPSISIQLGTLFESLTLDFEDVSPNFLKFKLWGPKSSMVLRKAFWQCFSNEDELWDNFPRVKDSGCFPQNQVFKLACPERFQHHKMNLDLGDLSQEDQQKICDHLVSRCTSNEIDKSSSVLYMVQRPSKGKPLSNGWDIILPKGHGKQLLMTLVFAGARAIGYSEQRAISLEAQDPAFPEDYADSNAGNELSFWKAVTSFEEYRKKPPAKRPNFASLHSPFPFGVDWQKFLESCPLEPRLINIDFPLLKSHQEQPLDPVKGDEPPLGFCAYRQKPVDISTPGLVRVQLRMIGTGVPDQNAAIHYLDDPSECGKQCLNGRKNIIGFLTDGLFSYSEGLGIGFGFCSAALVLQYYCEQPQDKVIVAITNPTGHVSRKAEMQILWNF